MSIGFLGAGKMAQAMARGLLASGTVTQDRIYASDVDDRAAQLMKSLPQKTHVARVMPNTPAIVRQGASAYSMGQNAAPGDGTMVCQLMLAVGYVEEVKEKQIAAVTGLSGSGPAYCFMAIEALADGGVKAGLPRDVATKLAAHTLMGAAKLVLESDKHPGELKDNVCSPEGATIYAVNQLERAGIRGILMDAVEAAMKRTMELGNEMK